MTEGPRKAAEQLAALREDILIRLREIEAHHIELNAKMKRPESHSKTLHLVREAIERYERWEEWA